MDRQPYYSAYEFSETSTALAPATPARVAVENYSRVMLILGIAGGNDVNVTTVKNPTVSNGFKIALANPIPFVVRWDTHGPLVGQEWWAVAPGAANVTTLEVVETEDPKNPIRPLSEFFNGSSQSRHENLDERRLLGAYAQRRQGGWRAQGAHLQPARDQRLPHQLPRPKFYYLWNPDTGWVKTADPEAP